MIRFRAELPYQHGTQRHTGILLVNLGTPDAPERGALRRYLKQFLGDPRVVEIPPVVWWLILNGFILNTRPAKSAAKYAKIWMPEGSPLRVYSERQARLLQQCLEARTRAPLRVECAMRYGQPSMADALDRLRAQGCDRILMLPLYPQYAASTSASSMDALFGQVAQLRSAPAIRTLRGYHDHPAYIGALTRRVQEFWDREGRPEKLVMSFHGVPRYTLDRGDPYHCECLKTGRLLAEGLGLQADQWVVAFQSLFGRAEWIKPYTEPTVRELARAGVKRLDVICPGFPADCLETLEEIGMEVRDAFLQDGGEHYRYIPALNDSAAWIEALADIAVDNLGGWLDAGWDSADAEARRHASRERALALGASR